jgi:ribosomal protein S18 acetylase RimI-like enzyme
VYVGTGADAIRAELAGLQPPWATTARVLRDATGIVGVVAVEWDDDLGRAWILGPWVVGDGDTWMSAAGRLLDAALAQPPPTVSQHEMAGDTANRRLAALGAARGWAPTETNHLLEADAAVIAGWPASAALRAPRSDDIAAIAALHEVEFPDTYASAPQLVAGDQDGSRVVLVADDGRGGIAGYVAGHVEDNGEGFIDFVAVDPAARGTGAGRQLVVTATRRLVDRSPLGLVRLTVPDHRLAARGLYEQLGFRHCGSLVAYRSWTA